MSRALLTNATATAVFRTLGRHLLLPFYNFQVFYNFHMQASNISEGLCDAHPQVNFLLGGALDVECKGTCMSVRAVDNAASDGHR